MYTWFFRVNKSESNEADRDVRHPTSCCTILLFASGAKCCETVVKPDKGCRRLVKSQSLFFNVNACDLGLVVAAERAMSCPWT